MRLTRVSWSRRKWSPAVVLEAEGTRLIFAFEDGRRVAVPSDFAISRGPVYVQLDRDGDADESYRSLRHVGLRAFETGSEREARVGDMSTASLCLVANFTWLPLVGFAASR